MWVKGDIHWHKLCPLFKLQLFGQLHIKLCHLLGALFMVFIRELTASYGLECEESFTVISNLFPMKGVVKLQVQGPCLQNLN